MAEKLLTASCSLTHDVQQALDKKPDYSTKFTNRVATLAHEVEKKLKVPVKHEPDMNESVSQVISLWLNQRYHPIPPRDNRARWRLNAHISSKGPYFAFVALKLSSADWQKVGLPKKQPYWAPVDDRKVPDALKALEKKIASVLKGESYQFLDDCVLLQQTGQKTEYEEPATVFDVIFGEP